MLRFVPAAALLLMIAATAGAAAQQPPPSDPAAPDIVVVGERTEEAIRNFVDQMAVAPRSVNQLARWDRKICPGVAGLRPRYAQFVIDRMAQRAFDVDLDVGAPGCRANVLIVVSPDPDAVALDLYEHHPAALGYLNERGRHNLGRNALADFVASDAPVRWWHVNRTKTRDGEPIAESMDNRWDMDPNSAARGAPVTFVTGNSSRTSRTTRQDFGTAIIIVDARRIPDIGFDWGALADYLAMVSLAQLDPDADMSSLPTILNLFAERAPNAARSAVLTEWDIAYLRGLYAATRDAHSAAQQEGDIQRRMARELRPQP